MPIVGVIYSIETFLTVRFPFRLHMQAQGEKVNETWYSVSIHSHMYNYIMYSVVDLNIVQALWNCNAVTLNVQGFDHMDDQLTLDDSMPWF